MNQISILGCGWLGLPLAKALIEKSFALKGSTTSQEKLSILEMAGISPFTITLESDTVLGNIATFLEKSETLIIDIPPKLRGLPKDSSAEQKKSFVEKIKNIIPFIEKSKIKNVLFISSTSVYGENNSMVSEETPLDPDTESGKQLVEVEQLLQKNSNFRTTILRFGGLIGEDRNPVKSLSGRKNLENPNAPINLIHQQDCIKIILKIINTNHWNETLNAVAPFHPSRKEYYTQKAIAFNIPLPEFNKDESSLGKTILSDTLERVLDYKFSVTDNL